MSMSDTSTSRSSSKLEEATIATTTARNNHHGDAANAAMTSASAHRQQQARRQSKLKGMLVRGMGIQGPTTAAAISTTTTTSTGAAAGSEPRKVVTVKPLFENQESVRLQTEHAAILKKIDATTSRACRDTERVRKEALAKETKVRAEIEQLAQELHHIETDEARKIRAIQEREANELEKLVKELKRL